MQDESKYHHCTFLLSCNYLAGSVSLHKQHTQLIITFGDTYSKLMMMIIAVYVLIPMWPPTHGVDGSDSDDVQHEPRQMTVVIH